MTEQFKRELFLTRQFEANSFQIGQVRLNSSIQDIDQTEIVDIFVDHKGYEQMKFAERLELLKKKSGWVHYAAGASFKIDNGAVKQIKLSTKYLQDNKTSKNDLINVFGQPDIELVDDICYSGFDYNIDAYILVYRQKQIYAFVDPKTEILKELHFGTLDEKIYGQKNKPVANSTLPKAGRTWLQKLFGSE
jgi:hypothetical protein